MYLFRRLMPFFVSAFVVGCRSEPFVPDGAVVGTWAGGPLRLVASANSARLFTGCGFFVGSGAMVADPLGGFVYGMRSEANIRGPVVITLRGAVTAERMSGELIAVNPYSTSTSRFTLTKGAEPDAGVICAAGAS